MFFFSFWKLFIVIYIPFNLRCCHYSAVTHRSVTTYAKSVWSDGSICSRTRQYLPIKIYLSIKQVNKYYFGNNGQIRKRNILHQTNFIARHFLIRKGTFFSSVVYVQQAADNHHILKLLIPVKENCAKCSVYF